MGIKNHKLCKVLSSLGITGDKNMAGDKYDKGKNRLDLVPPEVIEAVGRILTHGAVKYAPHNWQKGINYEKVYGAMQRHLQAFWRGELLDSESRLPHLWHAACNIAFLITYEAHPETYKQFDDRFVYGKPSEEKSDDEFAGYRINENLRCGWYVSRSANIEYLHKDLQFHKGTGYTESGNPPYGEAPGYYLTKEIAEAYLRAYLRTNKSECSYQGHKFKE